MKLQKLMDRAKGNKTLKSSTYEKNSGIVFTLEYLEEYEGEYGCDVFYAYLKYGNEELYVGNVYDEGKGRLNMWSKMQGRLVGGLTEVLEIERAHFDGNLTDNPVNEELVF